MSSGWASTAATAASAPFTTSAAITSTPSSIFSRRVDGFSSVAAMTSFASAFSTFLVSATAAVLIEVTTAVADSIRICSVFSHRQSLPFIIQRSAMKESIILLLEQWWSPFPRDKRRYQQGQGR